LTSPSSALRSSVVLVESVLSAVGVAVLIGVIVGAGFAVVVLLSARLLRSEHPENAVYAAMGALVGGLLLTGLLMFGYWSIAPDGVVGFAAGVAVSYMGCMTAGWLGMVRRKGSVRGTEK